MSPCDSPINAHILQMSSCLNSQPVMFYHHSLTSKMLLVLLLITKAIHVKCRNFGTRTKKNKHTNGKITIPLPKLIIIKFLVYLLSFLLLIYVRYAPFIQQQQQKMIPHKLYLNVLLFNPLFSQNV